MRKENNRIIAGNRRFTCLAEGLVRMEFSPTGTFEERRSVGAYEQQHPIPFTSATDEEGVVTLTTGKMRITSKENDRDFFPKNLEVSWTRNNRPERWYPGLRDHMNLGGTVASLDIVSRDAALAGSHAADMESPDAKANTWLWEEFAIYDADFYRTENAWDVQTALNRITPDYHRRARYHKRTYMAKAVNQTLDQHRYCPGILSESGYFLLNDSTSAVLDEDDFPVERNTAGTRDWYFFCYNNDYRRALRDYTLLAGKAPLPSKNVFGIFFSRWPCYNEAEAKDIVARFEKEGIPLSVLVLDMEWHQHKVKGWCNWDWDSKMFSDPKAFIAWAHEKGIEITLNVHPQRVFSNDSHFDEYGTQAGTAHLACPETHVDPQPGEEDITQIPVNMCNKREADAFMNVCHTDDVKKGMDFWWVDGASGEINGTRAQLVTNKVYYENVQTDEKRGMLLSRYGGLGSHRYGVFFTGDTYVQWEVLGYECEFNIRAGHIGVAYISHDIGGFMCDPTPLIDPVLFIRWLQFGVFNPVIRLHSAPNAGSRQPWDYGKENMNIARKWLTFRNSITPYIYTAARACYETGTPIVRGLFFDNPEDEKAYRYDEFFFGDDMLVAPVVTNDSMREVYFPKGTWYSYATGAVIHGPVTQTVDVPLADVPLYVKGGSILVRDGREAPTVSAHVRDLLLEVFPGASGRGELYEDDGKSRAYEKDGFAKTAFTLVDSGMTITLSTEGTKGIAQGEDRNVTVAYVLPSAPKAVTLDGNALAAAAITYDAKTRRATVALGRIPAGNAFSVIVQR